MEANAVRSRSRKAALVLAVIIALTVIGSSLAFWTPGRANGLRVTEARFVCMVNNKVFPKEQIAVPFEGRMYYGCCSMCASRIAGDPRLRQARDPVSGSAVDKAQAVIGVSKTGNVYYFESEANLSAYEPAEL